MNQDLDQLIQSRDDLAAAERPVRILQDEANRLRKRQAHDAAEASLERAFEEFMQHTDLRRCMDACGRVLEGWAARSKGSAAADQWNERANMIFDLGQRLQDLE